MIFCTRCGHPMEDDKKFCNNCGALLQPKPNVPLQPQTTKSETEPSRPHAAQATASHEETPVSHDTAAPSKSPVPEAPVSVEIPAETPAVQPSPAHPQIQEEAAPVKPKRNLFPAIFFPILGLVLTVLFIVCIPRISRLVWGIAHKDSSYSAYEEPSAPDTEIEAPAGTFSDIPTTSDVSTVSSEEEMYNEADANFQTGDYAAAIDGFIALGAYRDAHDRAQECSYFYACKLKEAGNFTDALSQFYAAEGRYDSDAQFEETVALLIAQNQSNNFFSTEGALVGNGWGTLARYDSTDESIATENRWIQYTSDVGWPFYHNFPHSSSQGSYSVIDGLHCTHDSDGTMVREWVFQSTDDPQIIKMYDFNDGQSYILYHFDHEVFN